MPYFGELSAKCNFNSIKDCHTLHKLNIQLPTQPKHVPSKVNFWFSTMIGTAKPSMVKQWLVNLIITHLFSWKQVWHKSCSLQNGQIHNAYQYMLSGSPSIGETTRRKTHELIIKMHEKVTWIDQIKQKLCLGAFGTCTEVFEHFMFTYICNWKYLWKCKYEMEISNGYLVGSWTIFSSIINYLSATSCKVRIYLVSTNEKSESIDLSSFEVASKTQVHKNIHIHKHAIVTCLENHIM